MATRRSSSPRPYSPPPAYSSVDGGVHPARYLRADEHTALLKSHGATRKDQIQRRRQDKPFLYLCAILATIFLIVALAVYATVRIQMGKDHPAAQPAIPDPAPINCSIAIIGAGPSGITAAFALAQLIAPIRARLNLNITIFEQRSSAGGRLLSSHPFIANETSHFEHDLLPLIGPEEIAGHHLLNTSPILQNHHKYASGLPHFFAMESRVGIYDGNTLLEDMLRPSFKTPWRSWLRQIFKYSASVWRAADVPTGPLRKLAHLSKLDKSAWYRYHNTDALLEALGLMSEVASTGSDLLRSTGISPLYETNVILPEMLKRLKQQPEHISSLALSMALQDTDKGSRYGGGRILPILQDMLDASGAETRFEARVQSIRRREVAPSQTKWVMQIRSPREDSLDEYYAFDKVVLAAPWKPEELEIDSGNDGAYVPPSISYIDDHVTFFTSRSELNIEHLSDMSESGIHRMLISPSVVQEALVGLRELAFLRNIVQIENKEPITEHLYRVFSDKPLDNATFDYLLGSAEKVTRKHHYYIETAYPQLLPGLPSYDFEWSDSFWHTGAVEAIGSSLDLSVAAGSNVAALMMTRLEELV